MKKKIAPKTRGRRPHTTLTQKISKPAPMAYTNRIPMVIISWKKLPRVPRMSFWAISPVYMGAVTQKAPPAIPRI